ncbi:hypothetical protein [Nocardiopsis sp. CC223A]|uniref:hypothetical protein n=1 Tax=Nocardiopsis sp. CC223A TaxID=3044051 RepID=UPI00278C308D|nr:hypothetical protein [Nocardiopsis sp. CC223A]
MGTTGGTGPEALACLDVFIGEWDLEPRFSAEHLSGVAPVGEPVLARSRFEWDLDGRFLVQRSEVSVPEVPDGLLIVAPGAEAGTYTQHYFDSRGVVRLYAMGFADGVWTLLREEADFSPLDFRQRFTGTFSADGNVIEGAWEIAHGDGGWEKDFDLVYRRVR